MIFKSYLRNLVEITGLPLIVIATSLLLLQSKQLSLQPALGWGIFVDLCLIAPLLYVLSIRKKNISVFTVIPVTIGCFFLARYSMPASFSSGLEPLFIWGIPVLELGILSFVVYKALKMYRILKNTASPSVDFMSSLRTALNKIQIPALVKSVLVTEISMVYYAFLRWKRVPQPKFFSSHKTGGHISVFLGIIMLLMVESIALHIIIQRWNTTIAWIFTFSSIYAIIQLIAHMKALYLNPSSLEDDHLIIRYGIFGEGRIAIDNIIAAEKTATWDKKEALSIKLALLKDVEEHNIKITLKEKEYFTQAYGAGKFYKKLYFYVDNPDELIRKINEICQKKY
ncbi:hypothetical protein [Ascidiimonas aurantiaca]|uniref:hypothetical protein n=1 Tax=Ascidiimonas aurantiaca TaxID=1685432 RepID=UPI0030ECE84D